MLFVVGQVQAEGHGRVAVSDNLLSEAAGNITLGSNGFSDTFQLRGIWFKRKRAVMAEAKQLRALRLCISATPRRRCLPQVRANMHPEMHA